jgi:hypothetical protein
MSNEKIRRFKQGCYNKSICYGGPIICIQGSIRQDNFDKILDIMDAYCDIQELLIEEGYKK